jgi:Flp pilus assembly protein TadG
VIGRAAMTTAFAAVTRMTRRLGDFLKDRRGVSAIEFALTLPAMLTLYLGSQDVTQGISIQQKVSLTAHAIADLSSQNTSITGAQMTNILNAGTAIIAPFPAGNLAETVSEIAIDSNGNATVVWSSTLNGTALTAGAPVTVPAALAVPNSYLILGQASYNYNPAYSYVLTNTMTLSDQYFLCPRQSPSISYSG